MYVVVFRIPREHSPHLGILLSSDILLIGTRVACSEVAALAPYCDIVTATHPWFMAGPGGSVYCNVIYFATVDSRHPA